MNRIVVRQCGDGGTDDGYAGCQRAARLTEREAAVVETQSALSGLGLR